MPTGSRTPDSDHGGSNRIPRWGIAAAAALALGLFVFARARAKPPAAAEVEGSAAPIESAPVDRAAIAPEAVASASAAAPSADAAADEPPLPGSLAGTTEDGALRVDADGNLVVGPDVLRFFDYYFSATGEERPEAIRSRIDAAIRRKHLGDRATRQALELLDKYVAYREAARRMGSSGGDVDARLAALHKLRHDHFGDQADKLFGDEERAVAVAIDQRRVMNDRTLSPEERDKKLAALEATLPPAVREARAESLRPLRERATEEAMRAAGASDDEIRQHRIATDGEEAADRLAALDRTRADWKRRLADFRQARAEIEQNEPDPEQRRIAVQKLLDASFTPQEQIRVQAADAIDREKSANSPK